MKKITLKVKTVSYLYALETLWNANIAKTQQKDKRKETKTTTKQKKHYANKPRK